MSFAAHRRPLVVLVAVLLGLALLGPQAAHAPPPSVSALAPVETLLDGRQELVGVAVAADGTTYVSDRAAGLIYRLPPAGPLTVAVSGLARPAGLALDGDERLLIAEEQAGRLLRLEPSGALTVLTTNLKTPRWLALAADGALYVSAHRLQGPDGPDPTEGREILRLTPSGTITVVATGLRRVEGLARLNGHLVAATKGLASGAESTGTLLRFPLLPDGSLGALAAWVDTGLKQPMGLAPDALSALYVSSKELSTELDTARRAIGKVHTDAHLSSFAQFLEDPQGLALAPDGSLLLADGRVGRLLRFRAPTAPTLNPPPAITNQASMTVSGTTEPQARLDLILNDAEPPLQGTTDGAGAFALPVTLTPNAANTLELFATTHAGDGLTSAPTTVTIIHDDEPPAVGFTNPAAGALLRASVPVAATATDPNGLSLFTVRVDSTTLAVGNTSPLTTSLDTAGLADGPHTLSATARDAAGNEASASIPITSDNTPPALAILEPAHGSTVPTKTPTLSVTYNDATAGINVSAFRATLDGTDVSTVFAVSGSGATATAPTPLAEGPHTLVAMIADQAGNGSSASSTFTVSTNPDFALNAAPPTGTAIQGMQTIFSVTVVPFKDYANLVSLSLTGLPTGVTATLTPAQVAPGASGVLAVTVPGSFAPGAYPFAVTGTGLVNGTLVSRSATASLTVVPAGPTALMGRVVTETEAPLANVTIRLGTLTTLTDGGGNFLLSNPPAGPQVVLIDGSTASTPTVSYPTIPVTVTIQSGQVTPLGFTPHLHAQPVTRTVPITPGQAATVSDPTIPGFTVQIPAGVTIIGWDGQPNTQIGMRVVPPDRSPLPPLELPAGFTAGPLYMFYFGKVGGGTPTAPVPIVGPNDLGALPGERVDLYFYDEAPDGSRPNQWAKYGTGTVSADGTQIVPDLDPATGKPYGMPRFCCGGWRAVVPPPPPPANPNLVAPGTSPGGTKGGEPVDLATGFFTLEKTDLVLPGRLPLILTRTYRSGDTQVGPFGIGGRHAYDAFLVFPTLSATEQLILVMPDLARYAFARQPDGSFRNATDPAMQGAVVTLSGSTRVLTFKDRATWTFDGNGRLIAQRDRNGNTMSIGRDGQGRVTTLTEPAARSFIFSYSGTSLQVTQVTDPIGRTVRYGYDGAGRLSSVTDSAGGVTSYTYDASHRLLTITDPRGITFLRNEYDSAGRVGRQTQADGGVWTFAYTLTSGVVTQTVVTDPRGNRTTARFNTQGYLLGQTDALGQPTSFEREVGTNRLLSTTDPLGRKTAFAYDGNGNVASITDAAGNVRTFAYEPTFNRLTSLADPLGNVTRFEYDPVGNLTAVVDPLSQRTTIAYNGVGQPLSTTDALGNVTRFTYTAQGDLATMADPVGNTSTREYDLVSRLTKQTDPRGKVTAFAHDPPNRLTQITDALRGVTRFSYDGNGNLLTVTDALNHTLTHEYDSMDRLSRRLDQLGQAETLTYDGNGNLLSATDRKGQTTTFTYDALSRRVRTQFADGAVATFAYDASGRLVLADDMADPHRPITLTYDALDRLVAETTSMGTVAYEYDILGRRAQMTVNDLNPVTYTYDAASRLRSITQAPLTPLTIDYDAVGRRTRLTLPNQVSTEYQYDAASRLTALIYRSATSLLGDLAYIYDAAGNRTGVGGAFARTLLPDPVTSATHDAANRQRTFGDKAMTHDVNGNLTLLTDPTGPTTFTWDARNRLVSLSAPGTTSAFLYDGFGRRGSKTLNGQATQYLYDGLDITQQVDPFRTTSYLRSLNVDEAFSFTNRDGVYFSIYDSSGSTVGVTDGTGTPMVQYTYEPFGGTFSTNPAFPNPFQFTGRENDATDLYYYRARYYSPRTGRFLSEDPKDSPLLNAGRCRRDFTPRVSRSIEIDPGLARLMMLSFFGVPLGSLPTAFAPNLQHLHPYTYANNNPINRVDPLGLISGPQSLGCDYVGGLVGGLFASPCGIKCCNEHDDCYKRVPQWCSAWSWPDMLTGVNPFNLSCQGCNVDVVICLAKASVTGGRKPCQ